MAWHRTDDAVVLLHWIAYVIMIIADDLVPSGYKDISNHRANLIIKIM